MSLKYIQIESDIYKGLSRRNNEIDKDLKIATAKKRISC